MTVLTRGFRWLRGVGERDALDGKPIEAFHDIPNLRHSETQRADYEIGYRAAKANLGKRCLCLPQRPTAPFHRSDCPIHKGDPL